MDFLLNTMGFILAVWADVAILRTLAKWRGILRDELFMLFWGFLLLALAFLTKILAGAGGELIPDTVLFAFATVLLFLGSSRIFTYTAGR